MTDDPDDDRPGIRDLVKSLREIADDFEAAADTDDPSARAVHFAQASQDLMKLLENTIEEVPDPISDSCCPGLRDDPEVITVHSLDVDDNTPPWSR